MNLRAWFDPKGMADLRQSLIDREVLGTWKLDRFDKIPSKRVYVHTEDLNLADGSSLRVSAMCDWTFAEPQNTLTVASGTSPLLVATGHGTSGLSATFATGKGGFLSFQISFDRDEQKEGDAYCNT